MSTWIELSADASMAAALEAADIPTSRASIRDEVSRILAQPTGQRNPAVLQRLRRRWSEQFARGCATMVANALRGHRELRSGFAITPDQNGGGQETFTPLGYKKGKRIDVVVSRALAGLQIGISLKGLNFRDDANGNFDKNLTGRLYELRDEVSTVHDYLPRAFMAALFYLPVSACFDKVRGPSSFAHTVAQLRSRTGRLDPSVAAHNWRCDFAAVGLYASDETDDVALGLSPGTVRYFPVEQLDGSATSTPGTGLPLVQNTVCLEGLVDMLLRSALADSAAGTQFTDERDPSVSVPTGAENSLQPEAVIPEADDSDDDALDTV